VDRSTSNKAIRAPPSTPRPCEWTPAIPPAFVAPASLETRVALAVWDDHGRLTVWTGTQTPFMVRAQVAAALGLGEQDVRVIVPPTGGGFGGKHAGGVATEAAQLAREVGGPVRVAWTRGEEFSVGTLRPAAVIDVKAVRQPMVS